MSTHYYDSWFQPREFSSQSLGGSASKVGRCYESHPPLKIGEFTVYGGSCFHPVVTDANLYVGFDRGMSAMKTYPWRNQRSFLFPITDHSVPQDVQEFMSLLDHLHESLRAGEKVHLGCIGGHGRTGLVLSALVNRVTGNPNATQYVRDNYCVRAVESTEQIEFLKKHFCIVPVVPSRHPSKSKSGGSVSKWVGAREKSIPPLASSPLSIWGKR